MSGLSNETLQQILEGGHALLAQKFVRWLRDGVTVTYTTTEGEVKSYKREVTAAESNVIRQFLKDNNIEAVLRPNSPLQSILDNLPFNTDGDLMQ